MVNEIISTAWGSVLNHGCLGGHHFLKMRRIGRHTVHFVCKALLLVVDIEPEVRGDPLHQMNAIRRTMELRNMGFYTMQFYEKEILTYPDQVKKLIQNRADILAMKKQNRLRSV
ncbi:MAG: DUF559 domain-containing protein [Cyclonatronaceae bacterium]